MKTFSLAAFSAERRIAAVALFEGTHLEDTPVRHLPVDSLKALGSVREMVTRTFEEYQPEFVAIATPSEKSGERAQQFCRAAKEIADQLGIPALEVDDVTLMCAYGHPPLTRKEHIRKVGRTIWPSLNDSHPGRASVDAALTGLYVQTERLFALSEVPE